MTLATIILLAVLLVLLFGVISVLALLLREVMRIAAAERREGRIDRERMEGEWRNERRELINRVQAPHALPVGTRRVGPPEDQARLSVREAHRRAWAGVGEAAPAKPLEVLNGGGEGAGDEYDPGDPLPPSVP